MSISNSGCCENYSEKCFSNISLQRLIFDLKFSNNFQHMSSGFIMRELDNYGITTEVNIGEHMASDYLLLFSKIPMPRSFNASISTLSLSLVVWFMIPSSSAEYSTSFVSHLEGVEMYRSSSSGNFLHRRLAE